MVLQGEAAGKSRLYQRLLAYITWETLLTFSFWKLLMLKDWNIPLPFLDRNVAHCLVRW